MGLFSALAIGIHSFPEGPATFVGALGDPAPRGEHHLAIFGLVLGMAVMAASLVLFVW